MEIVTKDNISSILLAGESETVELKAMARSAINVLPRIISAFANTEGGVIILGYDERHQSVIGTSPDDFEIVKKVILINNLANVCNAYIVQHEENALIIIQVEKSKSIVFAGGGAYKRQGDMNNRVLTSKEVIERIAPTVEPSESKLSKEDIQSLEKGIEQIYNELLRSQKAHEEELKEQKKEREKEIKDSKRSNWFFCILSAFIGYGLGKFF